MAVEGSDTRPSFLLFFFFLFHQRLHPNLFEGEAEASWQPFSTSGEMRRARAEFFDFLTPRWGGDINISAQERREARAS